MEKKVYIIRCGEVSLKGMNKPYFERVLLEKLKKAFTKYEDSFVKWIDGLMIAEIPSKYESYDVIRTASKVFGVASVSEALKTGREIDEIIETAGIYIDYILKDENISSFKVKAKRADKKYPIKSPDIARIVGGGILLSLIHI